MLRGFRKLIKIITIIIIITMIFVVLLNAVNINYIYPKKYSDEVYKYSKEYNIDSDLIFAIIKAESNFKPEVISKSNAIGLMQLMENTAIETGKSININIDKKEDLFIPNININIGVKYLNQLLEDYNGNINLSLIAYNAGKGNLKKWIDNGVIRDDGFDLENIPFPETKRYVKKILKDYKIYNRLYEN